MSRSSRLNRLPTPLSAGPMAPLLSWHAAQVALAKTFIPAAGSPEAHGIAASRFCHAAGSNLSLPASLEASVGCAFANHPDHIFGSGPNASSVRSRRRVARASRTLEEGLSSGSRRRARMAAMRSALSGAGGNLRRATAEISTVSGSRECNPVMNFPTSSGCGETSTVAS